MKIKWDLIQAWIKKAERDLISANHEMSFYDAINETICFHCQQSVEKYLKAYMIFLNIVPKKTHHIGDIIEEIKTIDKEIEIFIDEADILTDYAVSIRYPDEISIPSTEDAQEAIELAKKIKNYILLKIDIN